MKQTITCSKLLSSVILSYLLSSYLLLIIYCPTAHAFKVDDNHNQPALIPTYDRSSSTTKSQVSLEGPSKSNIYSETFELLTTTRPLLPVDSVLNTTELSSIKSPSIKPLLASPLPEVDSGLETDSKPLESAHKGGNDDHHDDSKFQMELNGDRLKPEEYINSIVNPEPYAKLLEFDEKEKPKEKPEVRVTIYHHQGFSDPVKNYGSGKPWNFYGTGYGLHYEHNKDGSYGREKGYQFEKAHGRDFCDKKDCQQQETDKEKVSETQKSPVSRHVEGLLKHNNVDIQKWYREGDLHKQPKQEPEVVKASSQSHAPASSLQSPAPASKVMSHQSPAPASTMSHQSPAPMVSSYMEITPPASPKIPKVTFVTQSQPLTLHKISSYLTTPPPLLSYSPTYYTPTPPTPATPLYRQPISYQTVQEAPPKNRNNYQAYSTPYRPPEVTISYQPHSTISYRPEVLPENRNRYNSFQHSPNYWQGPKTQSFYHHNNGNNYRHNNNNNNKAELQNSSPYDSSYQHYPESYPRHDFRSSNDFFRNFWPISSSDSYNNNNNNKRASKSSSTTFVPRYTTYLPSSTNHVPFRRERTFERNIFGWNPYS